MYRFEGTYLVNYNEKCFNLMLSQIGVSQMAISLLGFESSFEQLKGRLRNVNSSVDRTEGLALSEAIGALSGANI